MDSRMSQSYSRALDLHSRKAATSKHWSRGSTVSTNAAFLTTPRYSADSKLISVQTRAISPRCDESTALLSTGLMRKILRLRHCPAELGQGPDAIRWVFDRLNRSVGVR